VARLDDVGDQAGWVLAAFPTTQNVARMSSEASRASTVGVHVGWGPSSMVSAMSAAPHGTWVCGLEPRSSPFVGGTHRARSAALG
jgi:hypothetical protein